MSVVYQLRATNTAREAAGASSTNVLALYSCVFLISRRVDIIAFSDFHLMPAKFNFVWAQIVAGHRASERLNIRACVDHKLIL
jgi:hypothetical protein